jgi:hypothetical protein
MSNQPYDFGQAQAASREAAANQRAAEQFAINSTKAYAEAERAYRKALADKILELRAEGMAITACGDVARGDRAVADLKFHRDIAEGVKDAAWQSGWRASGDRKAVQTFCEWSMRRDLADGYRQPDGPAEPVTYGGRRAA